MNKEDILEFLNDLRRPSNKNPNHKWMGNYNGRQTIYVFQMALHPNEPENRKRITLMRAES